jgi:MRG/RNA binding activity-knot of a chromodomain
MVKVVEGENAWVIDNGIVYLCKVIKSIGTGKMRKFFIHYQGWKPKYDIWTDEQNLVHEKDAIGKERLMKSISLNPSTKVKEVKQKVSQVSKPITDEVEAVAEEPTTSSSSSNVSRRKILTDEGQIAAKKRRRALAEQDLIDEYSGIDGDYVMKIPVPLNIKKHLVDEWSLVAGNGKRLLSLPRAITVEQIIEEFLDEKEKKNTPETVRFRCLLWRLPFHENFNGIDSCCALGNLIPPKLFYFEAHFCSVRFPVPDICLAA